MANALEPLDKLSSSDSLLGANIDAPMEELQTQPTHVLDWFGIKK